MKKFMFFWFREYRPVCWLLESFEVCSYYCAYKHCESINPVNIISCLANWREEDIRKNWRDGLACTKGAPAEHSFIGISGGRQMTGIEF